MPFVQRANDGQQGMGLITTNLIDCLPTVHALNRRSHRILPIRAAQQEFP
jgi:hypothetical protein